MNKLIAALSIFLFGNLSHAACSWVGNTGTAANLTVTEINACVTDASSKTGDVTIQLPSGTISSTGTVTINMSSGFTNVTLLTVQGYGTAPDLGSSNDTIFNRGTEATTFFNITGTSGKKWRLTNMKITGGSVASYNPIIKIQGTSRLNNGGGWRVDHITAGDSSNPIDTRFFYVLGYTYGVFDHLNVTMHYQFGTVWEAASSGDGGNKSWRRNISVGTADAVYLEDSYVENIDTGKNWFVMDGEGGARNVVRYNTIKGLHIGAHDAASERLRSTFQYEAYNNLIDFPFNNSGGSWSPHIYPRGGTQIIYNNVMTKTGTASLWAEGILMQNYRSTSVALAAPWTDRCDNTVGKICVGSTLSPRACTSDTDCGGESGACQNIDLNTSGNGYPCRDQIGRTYLNGNQMTLYPSLFWNNTYLGSYFAPVVRALGNTRLHIQNNRDFCHHETTMPATCNGVATAYPKNGYAYPHPLTGGADTSAPIVNNTTPSTFECDAESPVSIALTRTTDEAATCRYAVDPETDWADMTQMATTGTTSHSQTLSLACNASYTYNVKCRDSSANESVNSQSNFAISAATTDTTAPVLSNPQPSGSIACGASSPVSKTISLTCTDSVGCTAVKCDTESGIDIDSMDITLSQSGTTWSATVNSLACNTVHTYYCKAEDAANNESASDTTLAFAINAASSVIEAESGTLVAPVASVSDATASGGYYIRTSTNFQGTATYTVNISTAGYYQLIGNFNCLDSGEDSWYFSIDGGAQQTWYLGGAYGAWVQRTFGTNQLFSTAGDKSVVFTGREANTKFDWFMFSLLSCAEGQRQYCISQSACEGVGGVWASGVCGDPPVVPAGNAVIRVNSGAGGGNHNASGRIMRPQ